MKVAIVDIGSNSLRLLLGEKIEHTWHNLPKRLWTTRLGDRNPDGTLKDERMTATFKALVEIRQLAGDFGAEKIIGIATSAVREASNGEAFMMKASEYCPMEYHIISGEEEARMGFMGAVRTLAEPDKHYNLIDIGGGSTEVAFGVNGEVYYSVSHPIGAVRLKHVSDEGPQRIWEETTPFWDPWPLEGTFGGTIAIGGTATTLAAIHLGLTEYDPTQVHGHRLSREVIEGLILDLRYKSDEERRKVPGLMPGRADIIVAGAEILTSYMDFYALPHIVVSEADGLEGAELMYV